MLQAKLVHARQWSAGPQEQTVTMLAYIATCTGTQHAHASYVNAKLAIIVLGGVKVLWLVALGPKGRIKIQGGRYGPKSCLHFKADEEARNEPFFIHGMCTFIRSFQSEIRWKQQLNSEKELRESAGMSNEVLCYSIIILAVVALAGNGKHNDQQHRTCILRAKIEALFSLFVCIFSLN